MAETFESLARSDKKLPLITVTHYDPEEELEMINYFLSQKVECVFTANLTALDEVSALCTQAGIAPDPPRLARRAPSRPSPPTTSRRRRC